MKLKTKLLLGTVLSGILVIMVSSLMIYSSKQAAKANNNMIQATRIVNAISQIRSLTFEHLLRHDQRSLEQWEHQYKELPYLLNPTEGSSPEQRATLQDIRRLSNEVKVIFDRLTESYATIAASPDMISLAGMPDTANARAKHQSLQERLATQILIKQQTQINKALELSSEARESVAHISARSNMLVGGVILFMLLATGMNFLLFTRTVTKSLNKLQAGAEAITNGQFSYRIIPDNPRDEFGRVASAFNSMAMATGQLDKAKSDFILLASHQLRTPLTAVKWYAQALATPIPHDPSNLTEQQAGYIRQISASNERMIELVNKLLDATAAETGHLTPHPKAVDVQAILEGVLADLSVLIRDDHISIITEVDKKLPVLFIDPAWLRIIFQDLISNSVRYSRSGQSVTITVTQNIKKSSNSKDADSILIAIADKGYGIPVKQQAGIFTKLFRADNAPRIIGEGSGLGLYITKTIVEHAGGTIWFKSQENKGSTFYVRLPLRNNAEASGSPAQKET